MKNLTRILVAMAWTMPCSLLLANAEQVEDPNLKFSLTIPEGFVRDPQLEQLQPNFIYGFRRPEPQGIGIVVIIERMPGTFGREKLDMSKMPPGFAGRVLTVRWGDFELEAIEVPEVANGIETVNYNTQVPLKHKAIQLRVVGRRDQKDQLLALTNTLLSSLKGESNWLASSVPPALAESSSYGTLILVACIIGVITGLVVLWQVRRVSRRGTVLGLSVVIYAISWVLPGETREMHAVLGTLRLLGFLGFLLGLFDLFRPPVAKRSAEE